MNKTRNPKIISLIALFALLVVFALIIDINRPEEYVDFVSDSPSSTGTKAIYTYFQEENFSVERWKHSPNQLSSQKKNQLLVMIQPFRIPESDIMNAYQNFIEEGNTVLLLATNPQGMFNTKAIPSYDLITEDSMIENHNGDSFQSSYTAQSRVQLEDGDEILLQDEEGVIALKREIGQGTLIIGTIPNWMTNSSILKNDHLLLLAELFNEIEASTILFDEYLHQNDGLKYTISAYPLWLTVLFFQCVLITLFWLWYSGKRFGPLLEVREETVRFSDEGIKALSSWHLKGKLYVESLRNQSEFLRIMMFEKWGLSLNKSWSDLQQDLDSRIKTFTEEEKNVFAKNMDQTLRKQKISKEEFLLWSQRMERIKKEVEEY